MKTLLYISIALLILACFPLPYGYYKFLRIAITVISVIYIVQNAEKGFSTTNVVWGIVAILFNPLIPIFLSKTIWVVLDLITAVWCGYNSVKENN